MKKLNINSSNRASLYIYNDLEDIDNVLQELHDHEHFIENH